MDTSGTGLRLHLGCGKRVIPGFFNVDTVDHPHVDLVCDVSNLDALPDGVAELIYASHVFEYFDRQQAVGVLKEWRRVLRSGGTLRLAVPDFDALVAVYQQTDRVEDVLGPLFGRMEVVDQSGQIRVLYHRTVWTRAALTFALAEAGFENVKDWDWRVVDHGSVDDHSQAYFPHMDKDGGLLVSLNLEATKPPDEMAVESK